MRDSQLFAVTSLKPEMLEAAFFRPFSCLQKAVDAAVGEFSSRGNSKPEILVVPDGSFNAVFAARA